jgi:hypothetical protein
MVRRFYSFRKTVYSYSNESYFKDKLNVGKRLRKYRPLLRDRALEPILQLPNLQLQRQRCSRVERFTVRNEYVLF